MDSYFHTRHTQHMVMTEKIAWKRKRKNTYKIILLISIIQYNELTFRSNDSSVCMFYELL